MAKKNDINKASALVGMGDFESMLNSISATQTNNAENANKNEKESESKAAEEQKATEEAKKESVAESNGNNAEEKKPSEEKKNNKKKRYTLDEILTIKKPCNGNNISLMMPASVRDFLNTLKDLSSDNTTMVNILTNIVEDFKNAHREEITERIRKMNEDKLNF